MVERVLVKRTRFASSIRRLLSKNAGESCSICGIHTGFGIGSIGEVAFICSPNGIRGDNLPKGVQFYSYENAVWLCSRCHHLIDTRDGFKSFNSWSAYDLREFKSVQERRVRDGLGELQRAVKKPYPQKPSYYSCFVSNSQSDERFSAKLVQCLKDSGVNCWHKKDDLRGGLDRKPQIREAIRVQQKMILVCSRGSAFEQEVVEEILHAIYEQDQTGVQKLFPIRLDDYISSEQMMERGREMVQAGKWKENWVPIIKNNHIPDFTGWESDTEKYVRECDKLLRDLQAFP